MYVTEQDLKNNVRELRAEQRATTADVGSELKTLYNKIQDLEEIVEMQNTMILEIRKLVKNDE